MAHLVSKGLVVPPGLKKLHSTWVPTPLNEKWEHIRAGVHEMLVPTGQHPELPITKSTCFGVWFALSFPCKGTISSPDTTHTNAMLCVLLSVLPECFNIWGHISAFLQPCPRAGKPGWTKQKLIQYIVPLGMVFSDTWAYSRLSQLNIHPHLPLFPFHSFPMPIPMVSEHCYLPDRPSVLWAALCLGCECTLPSCSHHHPQWPCLETPLCWYHQLPLIDWPNWSEHNREPSTRAIAIVTGILWAVGPTGALNEGTTAVFA